MQKLERDFIKADDAIEALSTALQSLDSPFSPTEEMAHLVSIFQYSSDATRYKIVSELIDLEYTGARPLLLDTLKNDKNPLIRHEAAFGLGILGNSSDCEALIDAMLNDSDPMVRHEAAIALAAIGGKESLLGLKTALQDSMSAVSASASYAIQTFQLGLYREGELTNV